MKSALTGLLCLLAASWVARGLAVQPSHQVLGLGGSLWGALAAEMMRPSLHRHWHMGRDHEAGPAPRRLRMAAAVPTDASLSQAVLKPNTPVEPSAGLRRHSTTQAALILQRALRLNAADWVLWDIALEEQKQAHRGDLQQAWSLIEGQTAPAIGVLDHPQANLAEVMTAATALSHLCELAHALKHRDANLWSRRFASALLRCADLFDEAMKQGHWQALSPARQAEWQSQLGLLQRLSQSYPKG
jgi:hypothetical protein